MAALVGLEEGWAEGQKIFDGRAFPKVLQMARGFMSSSNLEELLQVVVRENKAALERELFEHGALLLRGLPLDCPSHFDALLECLDWEEVAYVGMANREHVVGRVFTANNSSPQLPIPFHHEMIGVPNGPAPKIILFCEIQPIHGGETPLVLSHKIEEKMREEFPEFVHKLEEKGIIQIKTLYSSNDTSGVVEQCWPNVFGTSDKHEAERIAQERYDGRLVWLPDGKVKLINGPYKAVTVLDEKRQRKQWFNRISFLNIDAIDNCKNEELIAKEPYYNLFQQDELVIAFKDGGLLPKDAVTRLKEVSEEMSVAVPWKKGDVMIVDNLAVMHGRRPCSCPRRVLVSLAGY